MLKRAFLISALALPATAQIDIPQTKALAVQGGVRSSNPVGSCLESGRQPGLLGCSDARNQDWNLIGPNNAAVPGRTKRSHPSGLFTFSQVALVAGAAADISSSFGLQEANPVLGRGAFGVRHALLSGGITGVAILVERPILRRHPGMARTLTILNFAIAGARFGAAAHNFRQ